MGQKQSADKVTRHEASNSEKVPPWYSRKRLDPQLQRVKLFAAAIMVVVAVVGLVTGKVAEVIDYFTPDEPNVRFQANEVPRASTLLGLVPAEINDHIPENLREHILDVELYALDCAELTRITETIEETFDPGVHIRENSNVWRVQIEGLRQQSSRMLRLEVQGESRAEVTVLVREVSLTLTGRDEPPSPNEACIYAWVRYAAPATPFPPRYALTVLPTAGVGDVIKTTKPVNASIDQVGIDPDRGVLIFQVELSFPAPGGYDFILGGMASEVVRDSKPYHLLDGRYRWMSLDDLSDWEIFVDVSPLNFP